jgi:uncharacterized protein Yka (UPF0111/DUF47 family)
MEVSITLTQEEVKEQLRKMMKKDKDSYEEALQALNNLSQTNETNNNKQQSINLVLQNNYNDR